MRGRRGRLSAIAMASTDVRSEPRSHVFLSGLSKEGRSKDESKYFTLCNSLSSHFLPTVSRLSPLCKLFIFCSLASLFISLSLTHWVEENNKAVCFEYVPCVFYFMDICMERHLRRHVLALFASDLVLSPRHVSGSR